MKKYYLNRGDENFGPFNLEELRSHKITQETMVWFVGLDGWKMAKDIPELRIIFINAPSANPTNFEKYYISKMEDDESFFLRNINKFLLLFFIFFVIGVIIFFTRQDL